MNTQKSFTLIGGDLRQNYLLSALRCQGYTCYDAITPDNCKDLLPTDMLHNSSYVLGPIPFFQDGYVKNTSITAEEIKSSLHAGQHVFGGNLPKTLTDALEARGIYCHDYMKNEEIAIFNSIATAEGLIADIVTSYPGNLYKSRIVVLGYGKCARTLADRLKGLGCLVTVCARCENALALAYSLGHDTLTLDELNLYAPQFDIIINTIPALVVTKDTLQRITKKTFIYDIASKPGGVDFDTAKLLGLHASLHLSLPGKYAPKASGEALYHFIFKELKDYISE